MVNNMAKNVGYLISLNNEYLYSSAHGGMYAPLRVNEHAVQRVQRGLIARKIPADSCVAKITANQDGGKFILATEFNTTTKCTDKLSYPPSPQTKTEMCFKCLCNGKCTDKFMRDAIAKKILPELYDTKQR